MLTLAQRKTEDFIRQFFDKNGYAPTASEIAEGIGIKSRGVVHRYLKALVNAEKREKSYKISVDDINLNYPMKGNCKKIVGGHLKPPV